MLLNDRSRQMLLVAALLVFIPQPARADDPKDVIPRQFQGTWNFRLYSEDGGKTYRSGGNKPICEVGATEVRFQSVPT